MTYNIHPLFVHFPIALLFLYSVITVLPLRRWMPAVAWRDVGLILLLTGVLGAFAALNTGELAEHLVRPNRQLVETHSLFANIATFLYALLLVGELAAFLNKTFFMKARFEGARNLSAVAERVLCGPVVSRILAVLGLAAISVTGLLGGVMVYGTTTDPFAAILLKFLGINL